MKVKNKNELPELLKEVNITLTQIQSNCFHALL